MRIQMICPAPAGSVYGNRITAVRWACILRELGHRISVSTEYEAQSCDLLIALHAYRSADAVFAYQAAFPDRPVVVALTGTDVYRDIHRYEKARRVVEAARRLIALQPLAQDELSPRWQRKVRVIYQSAEPGPAAQPRKKYFDVCVLGHLRAVKDPFRTAMASRQLPPSSRIRILHAGAAIEDQMAFEAQTEERRNCRYHWLGAVPRGRVRRLLAQSRLLVLSSRMEGGANVISEALVNRVPVLASRIPGSVGLLGSGYPGYFEVGDTTGLARLLRRAEGDVNFYRRLKSWCAGLAPMFAPRRERAAWRSLLRELK